MAMSWQEAAAEAERLHPTEPPPELVPIEDARAIRRQAEANLEELVPMLNATHRLLLNRWPMDRSDFDPDRLTPLGHMSSKTHAEYPAGQRRGVLWSHAGRWQLKDPAVPFHMKTFASGQDSSVTLAEDKRDPAALTSLQTASQAALEWVPVELVLTLRSHGLPLPD